MKFRVELSDEDFGLLQAMAVREYRDVKQQASWLIQCGIAAFKYREQSRSYQRVAYGTEAPEVVRARAESDLADEEDE